MLARKKNKSTQKRTSKVNNKPTKVVKHVDMCFVYGNPVSQPKQPNLPSNAYIVTSLKFIHSIVFKCYSCGGKFHHHGYPDTPGDLIFVSKTKHVFAYPVTHQGTQSNEFSNVYLHFNSACIFARH